MSISVGDKVRFLNDVGGGVVTSFAGKNVINVLQDDGFEVPVLVTEVVVVEPAGGNSVSAPEKVPDSKPDENYTYEETSEGDDLKIVMALVPENRKEIPGNALLLYLINDSNYFVQFHMGEALKDRIFPMSNGLIEPNTKLLINTYSISNLDEMGSLTVQAIAFKKDKSFNLQAPVQQEITLNGVKLMKASSYQTNDYFHEPAIIFNLQQDDFAQKLKQLTDKEISDQIKEKEKRPRVKSYKVANPKNNIIEVDLHLHELVDSTAGMSNADMLGVQMDTFRKVLEENKNSKGQKIVFIHGVGNGTLKTDLRKELDRKYKYNYQDASFREYGFGATMVIIR